MSEINSSAISSPGNARFELLAPARDLECGIAAIDCGADAVYIGAPKFGAREAAGNDIDDIARLIEYAHRYWARVFVTVNTLLYEHEIPEAVDMIHKLHSIGADAVIIQDVGLLECELPPIALVASTQMHNNTPEKVAFLESVGFSRVILARELDIRQVRDIRANTGVELEFFIHGALCVCFSGQCHLSYSLGGRSGNRGQCAQPCRKTYDLMDASGNVLVTNKHLLSLADLNLTDYLGELIDAGVCSFKIEGRLKDRAYVSNVVAHYRKYLDIALAERGLRKTSSGTSNPGFAPDVSKTFNRGYSSYYIHGRGGKIGSLDTPKNLGEEIGQVRRVGRREFTLDRAHDLGNGDGLCFFDESGGLRGIGVNEVSGNTIFVERTSGLVPGAAIYRNRDHRFIKDMEKARPERTIGVWLKLVDVADGLKLIARDEDDVSAEAALICDKVPAEKPDRAMDNLRTQLSKTGGTGFECRELEIALDAPYFLPVSLINALRRDVLEKLVQARSASRPLLTRAASQNDSAYQQNRLDYRANVSNSHAEAFYRRHGVVDIERAAESGLDLKDRVVMTCRYCIRHQFGQCGGRGDNAENLFLRDAEGNKLRLEFDCRNCLMNLVLTERGGGRRNEAPTDRSDG